MVITDDKRITPLKSYTKQYYADYCKKYWKNVLSKKRFYCECCQSSYNLTFKSAHLKKPKHKRNQEKYENNLIPINNESISG